MVFLPLISITGVTGHILPRAGRDHVVSLFTSLGLALVWTPNLSHFLRRERAGKSLRDERARRSSRESLMAAEEASHDGFFGKVIRFYERWLRRALARPLWLARRASLLIVGSLLLVTEPGNGSSAGHG